jgi:ubiquinone/menaquinone biosynthesis C-methylase UbiE
LNNSNPLQELLGETDIYLLDQVMKGRYNAADIILDAGCGTGRNLHWFLNNGITIYGIDSNEEAINTLKLTHSSLPDDRFLVSTVEKISFPDNHFNHIISSAVLHFAQSTLQFHQMIAEMVRVLKPGGSLFIRMTSDIGIENKVTLIANGVYHIPDGSTRFLLTKSLLHELIEQQSLSFLEPLKTVNVNDMRCMSTLLLQKNKS